MAAQTADAGPLLRVRYAVEALIAWHVGRCRQREAEHHENLSFSTAVSPGRVGVRVNCRLRGQSAPANRYGISDPVVRKSKGGDQRAGFVGPTLDHTVRRGRKAESALVYPGHSGLDQHELIAGFPAIDYPFAVLRRAFTPIRKKMSRDPFLFTGLLRITTCLRKAGCYKTEPSC